MITKLFRCVKLAENAGYGFDKILKWEKATNTKIVFENNIDFSLVTFKFPEDGFELPEKAEGLPDKLGEKVTENIEKVTENIEKVTENTEKVTEKGEKVTEKVTGKVTENQRLILESISENPHLSSEDLSIIVGISAVKIRNNIAKLKAKGFIERIGPDKGGYWKIK